MRSRTLGVRIRKTLNTDVTTLHHVEVRHAPEWVAEFILLFRTHDAVACLITSGYISLLLYLHIGIVTVEEAPMVEVEVAAQV